MEPIPLIDIFAGPGGLGEGFCSLDSGKTFNIRLSIEKDTYAHRTLVLRAFFRQFTGEAPPKYYEYLAGKTTHEELLKCYPKEAAAAATNAWHAELGSRKTPRDKVDEQIARALGQESHRWVLIGGPPCQAYSLVGRARMRGSAKGETEQDRRRIEQFEADKRHHLYRHYLRILAVHRPLVFVMENVKGLLSAQVKERSIVERILRDLKEPSRYAMVPAERPRDQVCYRLYSVVTHRESDSPDLPPPAFIVRAEDYGIPQARHRVILLGVRSDLAEVPKTLVRADTHYTIYEAIRDLPPLRSVLSQEPDSDQAWQLAVQTAAESAWLYESAVDFEVRSAILEATNSIGAGLKRGLEFVPGVPSPKIWTTWFRDDKLHGFCNHSTRAHIRKDLHRYLYAAAYGKVKGHSPNLNDFPKQLLPAHDNVKDALLHGKFNDRFRVQVADRPSTTVTSHISKDGHYFIHYDPTQCRSLTVREAARLQTFPDNYFFEGPRTEQYKQVGNAVPPLLARQIAEIVANILE